MSIYKNAFVVLLIIMGILLTACESNSIEINEVGDLIYLEAKNKENYPPTKIMTYDIESGKKWIYITINSPIYNIEFDIKTNTLAVECIQNEIPYIYLINTNSKKILKKIKNIKLGAIFNNLLVYEDYSNKKITETKIVLMNIKEDKTQSFVLDGNPVNYTISKNTDKLVYTRVINRYSHLYVYDIEKGIERELIHIEKEFQPIWPEFISEDEIIYSSNEHNTHQLYHLKINDNKLRTYKISNNKSPWINPDYSFQLNKIAFEAYVQNSISSSVDIYMINVDGSGKQPLLYDENIDEYSPIWVK